MALSAFESRRAPEHRTIDLASGAEIAAAVTPIPAQMRPRTGRLVLHPGGPLSACDAGTRENRRCDEAFLKQQAMNWCLCPRRPPTARDLAAFLPSLMPEATGGNRRWPR